MCVSSSTPACSSAAITPRGTAAEVVAHGVAADYEFVMSPRLLEELGTILRRGKFERLLLTPRRNGSLQTSLLLLSMSTTQAMSRP